MKAVILILIQVLTCSLAQDEFHHKSKLMASVSINEMETSKEFWRYKAQSYLSSQLSKKLNNNKAKNVIMFLGDGMSMQTVAATRMLVGGEQAQLSFEKFPYFGFSQTYCLDMQVADSACTSTAYLSGVKGNVRTIGVNGNVKDSQCEISENEFTESIASWAQKSSKATGFVTTTRVTHASPAGAYVHTSNRDWEYDTPIKEMCGGETNIRDVAHQLVHSDVGKNLKVVLGGGRRNFITTNDLDDEGRSGLRTDGRNLIDEWLEDRSKDAKANYIWHKQQLDEIDVENTDYLMGLFESSHCMFNLDILNSNLQNQEPSLTDMTATAIKMLQKEENGYFLFVEGGLIDRAHHQNLANKALEDTKEFARAIEVARKMTNEVDTLIVVTSDHSHVMTYNGEANRGSDILGFAGKSDKDDKPYFTLSYANGPGYDKTFIENRSARADLSNVDFHNPEIPRSATVPRLEDTHGGEDVGVYASGPRSHLFTGTYEQNNIALLMAYAAQIGPYSNDTDSDDNDNNMSQLNSLSTLLGTLTLIIIFLNCFNR